MRAAAGLPQRTVPRRVTRNLDVRLMFTSARGRPLTFEALADVAKLFRLVHEEDTRPVPLGSGEQHVNPIYTFTGKEISEKFNFGFTFDDTETTSDADTTIGGTATTVTEVVLVPTGALDIVASFPR